ncbi:MAG: hypothetical protein LBJ09_01775 [Clostridiales bacterium]|nr:hypothetical protein [Clostridiales bacterium]
MLACNKNTKTYDFGIEDNLLKSLYNHLNEIMFFTQNANKTNESIKQTFHKIKNQTILATRDILRSGFVEPSFLLGENLYLECNISKFCSRLFKKIENKFSEKINMEIKFKSDVKSDFFILNIKKIQIVLCYVFADILKRNAIYKNIKIYINLNQNEEFLLFTIRDNTQVIKKAMSINSSSLKNINIKNIIDEINSKSTLPNKILEINSLEHNTAKKIISKINGTIKTKMNQNKSFITTFGIPLIKNENIKSNDHNDCYEIDEFLIDVIIN